MSPQTVIVELARIEAAHLAGLVSQFAELLAETEDSAGDPAIARLVPDAYPDDVESAREFRELTQDDLLARRRDDAAVVIASLYDVSTLPEDPNDPALIEAVTVRLAPDSVRAWLRTLTAVRLVMASRLGIDADDTHDADDPRFGIYDWVGYRLETLVRAIED